MGSRIKASGSRPAQSHSANSGTRPNTMIEFTISLTDLGVVLLMFYLQQTTDQSVVSEDEPE